MIFFSENDLMEQIKILQSENADLKKLLHKERAEKKSIEQIFTEGQLRKLKTSKQVQWNVRDIASAISLYAGGSRSYRLLRKRGYPLPAISTLRRWGSKINIQLGMQIEFTYKCNVGGFIYKCFKKLLSYFLFFIIKI